MRLQASWDKTRGACAISLLAKEVVDGLADVSEVGDFLELRSRVHGRSEGPGEGGAGVWENVLLLCAVVSQVRISFDSSKSVYGWI